MDKHTAGLGFGIVDIMWRADNYAGGCHTEGYFGALRKTLQTAIETAISRAHTGNDAVPMFEHEKLSAELTAKDVEIARLRGALEGVMREFVGARNRLTVSGPAGTVAEFARAVMEER